MELVKEAGKKEQEPNFQISWFTQAFSKKKKVSLFFADIFMEAEVTKAS